MNLNDLFCLGCFGGTFSLQVKEDHCLYQVSPRRLAYALQTPLKHEEKSSHLSSAGDLKVKALAQTARDVGLSPAWYYPFPCHLVHSKEKFISYIYISK